VLPTPVLTDGLFAFVDVRPVPGPLPPRFHGLLPATRREWYADHSDAHPPPAWVIDRLRKGDRDVLARVEASLLQLDPSDTAWLGWTYGRVIGGGCEAAVVREWLADWLEHREVPLLVRWAIAEGVGRFGARPELADLFASERVPDEALVAFFAQVDPAGRPIRARVEAVLDELVDEGWSASFCDALQALGRFDDGQSTSTLLDLLDRVGPGDARRAFVVDALRGQSDPRAAAAVPPLDASSVSGVLSAEQSADVERAVREVEGGGLFLLEARPEARAEVVAVLDSVVADVDGPAPVRHGALEQLVRIDRDVGLERAAELVDEPVLGRVAKILLRFPEPGSLERRLVEVGLVAADREPSPAALPTALLHDHGRICRFGRQTDQFPNEHDHVLHWLGAHAAPVLDDVLFVEVPPPEPTDGQPASSEQLPGLYRLRAYLEHRRYEVLTVDRGVWLDVPAMLGLLNTLCRDLGTEVRFAEVLGPSRLVQVVVGPAAAIERAVDDELIQVADAGASVELGQAMERALLADLFRRRRGPL